LGKKIGALGLGGN